MGRNKKIEDVDVLTIARKVFRDVGHSASTRDIASAAGISQAVLFQRFGSKEELFFQAMTPDPTDLDALLGAYDAADPFEHLVGIADRLAAYMRAFMPTLLKVLALPGVDATRLRDWHRQLPFMPIADALAERFRRLRADGLVAEIDPDVSAVTFMAALHSLVFFEIVTTKHERKHRQASVRALVLTLWRGLAPRS
jgi:AcrR family transcriptional regulator